MQSLFNFLAILCSVYMFIIFIRIILSWFGGNGAYGRPGEILGSITDPYLNWFRRFTFLRIAHVDLSPIAALGVLSLLNRAFSILARYGTIRLGLLLALALQILWSAVQFILGFSIIILILRLIAYLTARNTFGTFWRIVDTISQPIIYRINRILFGGRIVNYLSGLFISIIILALFIILGGAAVFILSGLLARLPI